MAKARQNLKRRAYSAEKNCVLGDKEGEGKFRRLLARTKKGDPNMGIATFKSVPEAEHVHGDGCYHDAPAGVP